MFGIDFVSGRDALIDDPDRDQRRAALYAVNPFFNSNLNMVL